MSDASSSDAPSIAIIGAGLAGLAAAWHLIANGKPAPQLTIFDKSRGLGGRLATRRLPNDRSFNHGAQYVRASDPRLQGILRDAIAAGQAEEWTAPIADGPPVSVDAQRPRFVGTPGMSALGRVMMAAVDKQAKQQRLTVERYRQTQITKISKALHGWLLEDQLGDQHGPYDHLLMAIPAPQAKDLLTAADIEDANRLERMITAASTAMVPCWSLMVAFEQALPLDAEAQQFKDHPLAWIGKSASSDAGAAWHGYVVHAAPDWSATHLEEGNDTVIEQMLGLVAETLKTDLPPIVHKTAHRWRYAFAPDAYGKPCVHDASLGLTLAGDWCLGNRAESAFLSGVGAAEAINPQA